MILSHYYHVPREQSGKQTNVSSINCLPQLLSNSRSGEARVQTSLLLQSPLLRGLVGSVYMGAPRPAPPLPREVINHSLALGDLRSTCMRTMLLCVRHLVRIQCGIRWPINNRSILQLYIFFSSLSLFD